MLPGVTENLSGKRGRNPASSGPSAPGRKPLPHGVESVQPEKPGKIPSFPPARRPDSGTPAIAYSDWWRVFGDAELASLEDGRLRSVEIGKATQASVCAALISAAERIESLTKRLNAVVAESIPVG